MLDGLYNELVCLCEVRGELDDEGNAYVEAKIAEIQKQIKELEAA